MKFEMKGDQILFLDQKNIDKALLTQLTQEIKPYKIAASSFRSNFQL